MIHFKYECVICFQKCSDLLRPHNQCSLVWRKKKTFGYHCTDNPVRIQVLFPELITVVSRYMDVSKPCGQLKKQPFCFATISEYFDIKWPEVQSIVKLSGLWVVRQRDKVLTVYGTWTPVWRWRLCSPRQQMECGWGRGGKFWRLSLDQQVWK